MAPRRLLFAFAIFGILVSVLLRFAPFAASAPLLRILALGLLAVVPLTLAVLPMPDAARARPVPAGPIARMLDRWQVPDATEACQVEWIQT